MSMRQLAAPASVPSMGKADGACDDTPVMALVRRVFLTPAPSDEFVRSLALVSIDNDASGPIAAAVAETLVRHVRGDVCLVDARLASPSLHTRYELSNHIGLSDALIATGPIRGYTRRLAHARDRSLWLMPAGSDPARDAPLWMMEPGPARLRALLAAFDFVVVHTPEIMQRGAAALAAGVKNVIVVADAQSTRRASARSATVRLRASGARILGGVLVNRTFPVPDAIYRLLWRDRL